MPGPASLRSDEQSELPSDGNDPAVSLKAMADTDAQISVIKARMLGNRSVESLWKLKLQPYCGYSIQADCCLTM